MYLISGIGLVHLEVLVVLVGLVLVGVNTNLVGVPLEGDGGVEADLAVLLVVDGADLESVLVSADEAGLLSAVAGGAGAHDGGLGEDAGAAVGVGTFQGVDGRESDTILVILAQMEMSREPCLNTTMLPNQLNKLLTLLLITMIQPTTSIDDMILLQDPQSTSIRRSVRKDENLPSLIGRMRLDQIFEPINLFLIDCHLVRSVNGIPE
mmetsp:Transcript_22557/g.40133  ORF Transcript_22557/g.40133 Transcript_22557/m.40133 type:complete len:208 (-) Transcript_22557:665-1288(-)